MASFFSPKGINVEKGFIRFLSLLMIALIIPIAFLYYSSMQALYSEQLEQSNRRIIEQVGVSYELIMKQITDAVYKIPLYDDELVQFISNYKQSGTYRRELFDRLDKIVLSNDYLAACYLYLPEQDRVFSSENGNSYATSDFYDLPAIEAAKRETISMLDPRHVDAVRGKSLFISIVSPLPLSPADYEGVIVVNIDARKLYYDILNKIKAEENMNFFVHNQENVMIISKDESLLFKSISLLTDQTESKFKKISTYFSKSLKWTFVLETNIGLTSGFTARLYLFLLRIILVLATTLIVASRVIKITAKPVNKVLSNYNEKLWKDFLTESSTDILDVEKELIQGNSQFKFNTYAVLALQVVQREDHKEIWRLSETLRSALLSMNTGIITKVIEINAQTAAAIINFQADDSAQGRDYVGNFAGTLYEKLENKIRTGVFISVSLPHESADMIPRSYRECMEILQYKIVLKSSILNYFALLEKKSSYRYSYELEKQMVNNLAAGNREACISFFDRFFLELINPRLLLSDSEIKSNIYQIQTAMLRSLSGLAVPIRIHTIDIGALFDAEKIRGVVVDFIEKTIKEIKTTAGDAGSDLFAKISAYIENNYTSENFNLNTAADELKLSRNYLAKIIKERYNVHFNDYINRKRMLAAKRMLSDKELPIEYIAYKVGFHYSHYFIKVFKKSEGITPGQYRDRLLS